MWIRLRFFITVLMGMAFFGLSGCGCGGEGDDPDPEPPLPPLVANDAVTLVGFGGGSTRIVDLSKLELSPGKQIYLVTVNTNSTIVDAGRTGGAAGSYSRFSGSDIDASGFLLNSEDVPPGHHPRAVAFNANPPPITLDMRQNRSIEQLRSAGAISRTVGDIKDFWVEAMHSNTYWVQKSAKLRAIGTYCNIWVIENWGTYSVSDTTAQTLAAKFDQIYPLETKILGYEYGGGQGSNGGKDGDSKVQILVYDFNGGGGVQGSSAAGFFWSKDFYTQAVLDSSNWSVKTNLAEMFYIDAGELNSHPDYIYSSLVHEFQHMINFNVKYVKHSKSTESWYNEMLSMMAEDMISPLIGVVPTNSSHPIGTRIRYFLAWYFKEGVTTWTTLASSSYSYKYAFGAYLARNYGGAELVKNILTNGSTNIDSISSALKQTAGIDFNYAVEKFAEALIFSAPTDGDGRATFNKTVDNAIDGTTYTFTGFDIWSPSYNFTVPAGSSSSWGGPTIYSLWNKPTMQPYSVYIQSSDDWKTGAMSSVILNRPAAAGVKLYLMIR
ncbi:M30 family zinc metallopeptidase [Breznakiellaceae bacterium SP9]